MNDLKAFILIKRYYRTVHTFGWNVFQKATCSPEDTSKSKNSAIKLEACPEVKCIPPNFASSGKNICVYEPSPQAVKPCKVGQVDPEWRMAEAPIYRGPKVIILGAGFAGLTAADRLINGGHDNLIVLEADCRAGGRLKSRWAGDTVVELGLKLQEKAPLSWEHPLISLGLADGLFPPPIEGDPSSGLLDHPLPLPVIFKTYSFLKKLMNEELCTGFTKGYLGLRCQQASGRLPGKYRNEIARILAAVTSFLGPKLQVEENSFGAFAVAPGGAKVPLGDSCHLLPLLESVGPERILYKKEAVSIRWGTVTMSQSPRVIVRCRDGSEYSGEFVIISCSLGSLKSSMDSMFYPPLPSKKACAIQNMGYEQQNMAYLIFEEPIWTWSSRQLELVLSYEPDCDWVSYVKEMKQVNGSQHVIGVRVTGPGAVKMERAPKEEVIETLHCLIKSCLSVDSIPKPKDVVRSRWSGKRYFGGSHSSRGSAELVADLAAPLPSPDQLPPILLFAGEATCPQHGLRAAILSGLREAERLLTIIASMPTHKESFVCPIPCP